MWLGLEVPLGRHVTDTDPIDARATHVVVWEDDEWHAHRTSDVGGPACTAVVHGSGRWEIYTRTEWESGLWYSHSGDPASPFDTPESIAAYARASIGIECTVALRSWSWLAVGATDAVTWPIYEVLPHTAGLPVRPRT